MKKDPLNKNSLRRYRKRAGLEQKQVAFLLNRAGTDEVSRHEKGAYRPNLETALKLEVIYQVPIRLLYPALFERCRREIAERKNQYSQAFPAPDWFLRHPEQLKQEEYCFYAGLLTGSRPNALELEAVDKHTINLANTSSYYKQGRDPYA